MESKAGDYRSYMFGTKKIQAKIMNDKLVVKVGGGFMVIQEFLDQYTQIEYEKLQAQASKTGAIAQSGINALGSQLRGMVAAASPNRQSNRAGLNRSPTMKSQQ